MKKKQTALSMSCGALAGLITGLLLYIFRFFVGFDGIYDFLRWPLLGTVVGGVLGIILVRFRRREVQQRRYWSRIGALLGILALSPHFSSYLLFLPLALLGDIEYGPPLAVLGVLLLFTVAGALAGGLGGLAGGMLFTRYSRVWVEKGG